MTFDGNNGFSLDVPVPDLPGGIYEVREGELIIGGTAGQNDDEAVIDGTLWALSLEPGKEGTLLWQISFTPPKASLPLAMAPRGRTTITGPTVDPEDGVFLFSEDETTTWWGYDLETGQQLWKSEPEPAMNYYGMRASIYQGKLFSTGYGGELIAYDIKTGEVLWKYVAQQVGFESPYGNYPIGVVFIADGKIYLTSGEHSATQPLWRGPNLRCIDAETGEEVWKIMFWGAGMSSGSGAVIADGYIVGLNYYDNQIYCIGKGPSETTVTAEPAVIEKGSSIMIKGTVTDQSPGAKGTAAIADEYQEDWMEYVYMQQSMPADAQGVTVKVYSIDPNGNYQDIGEVTSDIWGNYGIDWKPPVEGKYIVMAEFSGSASYGSSSASTYFTVDEAPTASALIEPEAPAEAVGLGTTELAVIAVATIAVVCVVAFWALRKRK
jgi:outer membrane protein assembly factor BamB